MKHKQKLNGLANISLYFLILTLFIASGCSSGGDGSLGAYQSTETQTETPQTADPQPTGTNNDLNGNGVRDDVDALIDSKPYTDNQKTALRRYANKLEKFISATNDDTINAMDDEITASLKNFYSEFGADINALNEIKDKELDTKEKMKIYLQSQAKLNGKVD